MTSSNICILCRTVVFSVGNEDENDRLLISSFVSDNKVKEEEDTEGYGVVNRFYNCIGGNFRVDLEKDGVDLGFMDAQSEESEVEENLPQEVATACGKCKDLIKSTTEVKMGMSRMETSVRRLELQLLQENKCLQEQSDRFLQEMRKIEELIKVSRATTGRSSSFLTITCQNALHLFEKRVQKAIKKVSGCKDFDMEEYTEGGTINNSLIFHRTDNPSSGPLEITTIKVERNEIANSTDDEEDYLIEKDAKSDNSDMDPLWNESDHGESNSGGSNSESDDNEDDDDDGQHDQKPNVAPGSSKHLKESSKDCDFLISSFFTNVNFQKMSGFKQDVINRLLTRKERILKGLPPNPSNFVKTSNNKKYNYEDPRDKYFIDYNPESDTFFLNDITITLNEDIEENSLQCSKCGYRAYSKNHMNATLKILDHILGKHLNAFQCSLCGRKHQHHGSHMEHCRSHFSNLTCDICGKPIQKSRLMPDHKWSHMSEEERLHAVRSGLMREPYKQPKIQGRPFLCFICGKSFNANCNLKKHLAIHEGKKEEEQKTTVCPVCGKSMLEVSYYRHRSICKPYGAKGPPFKCVECDKTYKNEVTLKHHFRHTHTEKANHKPHLCSTCGLGFRYLTQLKKHLETHSDVKNFVCSKGCGAKLRYAASWKRHEEVCTGSGARPGRKGWGNRP